MRDKKLTGNYFIPHFDQKRRNEVKPLARRNPTPLKHINAFHLVNWFTTPVK
jgi:hypothetical protein